jgi:hypothetical protein
MYHDGTPFLWMGDTQVIFYNFTDLGISGYDMRDGSFQIVQDTRASQGYNNYVFGTWIFRKTGNFQENEGGFNFLNDNANQLNPAFWQWADKRIEYVNGKGIIPALGIGWPDQGIFDQFTPTQLARAWRYMIARYSAYNIIWGVFGEANEAGSNWISITNEYGSIAKKYDPYNHLRTTHHTSSNSELVGQSWFDFILHQNTSISLVDSERAKYQVPIVNAESYYEGDTGTADDVRRMSWKLMTHGSFFTYGDNIELTTPGRTYNSYLVDFYKKIPWWKLEPNQSLVSGNSVHAHALIGSEYVAYLESGGSLTLDLTGATGTLSVEWFNPRTGTYTGQTTISGGAPRAFTPPGTNDWVLHVSKQSSNSNPPAAPGNLIVK